MCSTKKYYLCYATYKNKLFKLSQLFFLIKVISLHIELNIEKK